MPAARNGAVAWIVLLAAVFIAGAWDAMVAPLATGDVYPPYSTLRADPMGSRALFESLSEQSGLEVSRLYKARSPLATGTALFILGVDSVSWRTSQKAVLDDYEKLLKNGGRIVIAFLPARAPQNLQEASAPHAGQPDPGTPDAQAMERQWHIRLLYRKLSGQEDRDSGALPRESALYFDPGPEWRVLQRPYGDPSVVERDLAGGTLVLVQNGYRLSNQGLAELRDADLIAHLAGPSNRVLFDENQFGVAEVGSVAVLLRKYQLEGALAILFAVAGLFIWRTTSSFLPPRSEPQSTPVAGRDSREGLVALLRRSIPEDQLLAACWKQWSRSAPRTGSGRELMDRALHQTEDAGEQRTARDPVADYRAACRVLTERK
jgi:hypothetical protein